jgi:ABC-type transport system involved in cytochrome bd biosynthesis fused ATPase/permease subunit
MAALPWVAAVWPHAAPMLVVIALVVYAAASRARGADPWASGFVTASTLVFLTTFAGLGVLAVWMVLALVVVVLALMLPALNRGRPDTADMAAVVGWATMLAARPELMAKDHGGWLAPAVLLLAARRLVSAVPWGGSGEDREPLPPSHEARGTLSLRGVVATTRQGVPGTVPMELELRAGDSLAILCDAANDRELLMDLFSGRRMPAEGEFAIDGMPLDTDSRLVAVVALGERFVAGGLEANVGALADEAPERETLTAVREACGLDEVAEALGDGVLASDGRPLEPIHRLLLMAARVIPSHYRLLVVVDPMPWVNPVRGQRWRTAVVRASVGRTAIWITADRDLASRASKVMEFRQGALNPTDLL